MRWLPTMVQRKWTRLSKKQMVYACSHWPINRSSCWRYCSSIVTSRYRSLYRAPCGTVLVWIVCLQWCYVNIDNEYVHDFVFLSLILLFTSTSGDEIDDWRLIFWLIDDWLLFIHDSLIYVRRPDIVISMFENLFEFRRLLCHLWPLIFAKIFCF